MRPLAHRKESPHLLLRYDDASADPRAKAAPRSRVSRGAPASTEPLSPPAAPYSLTAGRAENVLADGDHDHEPTGSTKPARRESPCTISRASKAHQNRAGFSLQNRRTSDNLSGGANHRKPLLFQQLQAMFCICESPLGNKWETNRSEGLRNPNECQISLL